MHNVRYDALSIVTDLKMICSVSRSNSVSIRSDGLGALKKSKNCVYI
ncbi:hypothetical protein P8452_67543 [Trifolium repens]|nr:hypothetical protein P8452_67543 [Trifolium repens]